MATYTSYLNLEKPATSENFNLSKINSNWDKIDAGCSAINDNVAHICKNSAIQYLTDSSPVSVTPATTLTIVCGQYSTNGFMYLIFRASATNATICPIKTDSNITVSTSNGVVTFTSSSSSSYRVQAISLY